MTAATRRGRHADLAAQGAGAAAVADRAEAPLGLDIAPYGMSYPASAARADQPSTRHAPPPEHRSGVAAILRRRAGWLAPLAAIAAWALLTKRPRRRPNR